MGEQRVAVVADSTLALPEGLAEQHGITIVSVHVVVDGRSMREGVDITPSELAGLLRAGERVTTSRPSPQEFLATYRRAADAGASAVVSVHLSAELSGTAEAARVAAKASPVPVAVVDTRTIAMAAGYGALDAAAVAAAGGGIDEVAEAARATARASSLLFYVDTLEYLQRGGRIGAAARYFGQALRVKPLLAMDQGHVAPLEKVRTSSKALLRLVDLASEAAERLDRPRLAVHHLQASSGVAVVRQGLARRLPGAPCLESEVGAVIGAHSGPGLVAVAVVPGAPT